MLFQDPGLAQDGADPGGGVLDVGSGVAGQGQHPVEVEDVFGVVPDGEVGVLDRADAHLPGRHGAFLVGELGTARVDHGAGAVHGLLQQGHELDRGAGSGT